MVCQAVYMMENTMPQDGNLICEWPKTIDFPYKLLVNLGSNRTFD